MPEIILNPDRYTAANPVLHGRSSGDYLPSDSCLLEVSTDGVMVNLNGSVLDGENTINAGIYVLEPAVFDYVPRGAQLDMPDLIKSLIADKRRVISFPIREYWLDVGRHDDYAQANDDFEGGKVRLELG